MIVIIYFTIIVICFHFISGCNIFRNFTVNGPIPLNSLPFAKDFSSLYDFNTVVDGRDKCSENQVPEIAKKYLARSGGCFEKTWSIELVESLVEAAKNKIDFSPKDYPYCVVDYYSAIGKQSVEGKRVLVAGSISPWNEAIFIANGAREVVTSEYSNLVSLDTRIKVVRAQHLMHFQKFDAISSFSSIEHDGLGRYGDPINPNGDFDAISEFHFLLNPGGILYLGIPISGNQGYVEANYHRLYNYERFNALIKDKFNLLYVIEDHFKFYNQEWNDWKNQPLFVLEKI